jgi:hypothetical protein
MRYGSLPEIIGEFDLNLSEVMHYLYLPVKMERSGIRLPPNVECCRPLIEAAIDAYGNYQYAYLTARKGWASPDNPLNRPGWHCDGFGTNDMNLIWWRGPGTRIAVQDFADISGDHVASLKQFEAQVDPSNVVTYREQTLIAIDPFCVHATPLIQPPGCWRQFIKVSMSDQRYNLENNSHNYLFDYDWPMHGREDLRNDPTRAQVDSVS